jgi:septum formation protein
MGAETDVRRRGAGGLMIQPLTWTPDLTLVLASASPQRRAILAGLGIAHAVRATHAEELEDGDPRALAAENARRKAAAGRAALDAGAREHSVVLACDTVVALDGRAYGKPADEREARAHLAALAGRTHEVLGALAVAAPDGRVLEQTDITKVTFAALTEPQIAAHVATGEWDGRAGGYAIQGAGAALVERIEGDYLNVVGLPVHALRALVSGLVPPFDC